MSTIYGGYSPTSYYTLFSSTNENQNQNQNQNEKETRASGAPDYFSSNITTFTTSSSSPTNISNPNPNSLSLFALSQKLASTLFEMVLKKVNSQAQTAIPTLTTTTMTTNEKQDFSTSSVFVSSTTTSNIVYPPLPVYSLPSELLAEIFQYYLADDSDSNNDVENNASSQFVCRPNPWVSSLTSTPSGSATPLLLSHVCSHWRAVTCSTPALWSSLAVYKPSETQLPVVREWLARAGAGAGGSSSRIPLSLSIEQGKDVRDGWIQSCVTMELLEMFVAVAERWQHVRFVLNDRTSLRYFDDVPCNVGSDWDAHTKDQQQQHDGYSSNGTPLRLPKVLPLLESATVDFTSWNQPDADRLWNAMFASSPRLHRVDFGSRYRFKLPFVPLSTALDDSLPPSSTSTNPWARLTHLTMRQQTTDDLSLEEFLEVLKGCPMLEDLDVAISWPVDAAVPTVSTTTRTYFTLPRLRKCTINAWKSSCAPLLNRIACPSLEQLKLVNSGKSTRRRDEFPCVCIEDFLERSWRCRSEEEEENVVGGGGLEMLSLTDKSGVVREEDVVELVEFLGGRSGVGNKLKRLEMHVERVGGLLVRALTNEPPSPPSQRLWTEILPELAFLSMSNVTRTAIAFGDLQKMAVSRKGMLKTLVLGDMNVEIYVKNGEWDRAKVDLERQVDGLSVVFGR